MSADTKPMAIRFDDAAVSVMRCGTNELQWVLRWNEIIEIAVWKRDLFAVDLICMGFRWDDTEAFKETDEQIHGWTELMREIKRRFGVSEQSWWRDVAFPAFADQFRVIWKRQ